VERYLDIGVTILNPQGQCNGLEALRRALRGKVCMDLGIDRQTVVSRGTPVQVEARIRRCVETLGSPAGGLMLSYGLYEGIPVENMEAVFRGMYARRRISG
jgi:hypothetical protein